MRSTIILLVFFAFTLSAHAGNNNVDLNYDSLTYQDYINGNWKALIKNGNEGIANGAITINIRKRLGYAYFMQKNFLESASQYIKIYNNNKSDIDARTMLYYDYYYIGDHEMSDYFNLSLSSEEKKSAGINSSHFIQSVEADAGVTSNNNLQKNGYSDLRKSEEYGIQTLNKDLYFMQATAS